LVPKVPLSYGHLAVVDLFFARSALRWGAVLGGLLAPFVDMFREVNDLATLHDAVASIGVHRAWAAATLLWSWALVAIVPAPSRGCNDQSGGPWLLVVAVLLLFLLTVPGDGTQATRLGSPGLWGRVPCAALGGSGAFVGQSEECGDSLHVVRGQLLQHFLITYSMTEGRDDESIGNARYSTSHLGEAGDERPEGLPGLLPHRMEVGLHTVLLVRTGEVRNEPCTELFPKVD
jgi:hypothetical protein